METGLKQGDALSPVLFNFALKKVIRILQDNEGGLLIGQNKIRLLGYANDLDIMVICLQTQLTRLVLEEAMKKIGLEINTKNTMIMKLIECGKDFNETENLIYEKVSDYK